MRAALLLILAAGCYDVDSLSANFTPTSDLSVSASDDLTSREVQDLSSPDLGSDASAVAVWETVQSPVSANLRGLAADGNVLYAVGASSTILHIAPDDAIGAENVGPGYNLRGAAAAGGEVWAVGDSSAILVRSLGWQDIGNGLDNTLDTVFGLSATGFDVAGSGGFFANGMNAEDTGVTVALFSLWARNDSDVFAVGEAGTIIHRGADAGVWSPLTSTTASDLHGVFGSGSTLFAAGSAGTVLRSDNGTAWSLENVVSDSDFFAVWVSGNEAFVVGDAGLVLHRKNGAWTVEHSGGPALHAVLGRSATDVWAVGDNGTILRFHP